jgi:ubiquinone/menaquinone biosynthesis C-methylase UbiE
MDFSRFREIQQNTGWGRVLADFAAFCAPAPGARCLDVGTGPGLLPSIFAQSGCRALGCDLDPNLLAARLHPNLIHADAYALPFAACAFDLLTATNVLFLLPEPRAALREWIRCLKPGAVLALLNPSEQMSLSAVEDVIAVRNLQGEAAASLRGWARNAENHARWTEGETVSMLSEVGVRVTESRLRVASGLARFTRGVKI